jgi:hypothetical protein
MSFSHHLLLLYLAYRGQYGKKDEGNEEALPIQEGFLQESFYRGAPPAVLKDSKVCSDPTEDITQQKLRALQNDQAYIMMMGFDHDSFEKILERFAPMFSGHTPFNSSGMIVEFEYTV